MKKVILSIFILGIIGCTDNARVKTWGGSATINLPKGEKLVNVTWKETNLWILTKPMKFTDSAEIYIFKEESSFGIVEGEYNIIETK